MFNLKRKLQNAVHSIQPPVDVNAIIEEIHNEFDSASEKLLNEARDILNGSYDIEKGNRLNKLGFRSAKKAVEAQSIKDQLSKKEELNERIMFYQKTYPNYKFITEGMVKDICKKYSLCCGRIGMYIGDVPEKNISEMESFVAMVDKIKDRMHLFVEQEYRYFMGSYDSNIIRPEFHICAPLKDFDTKNTSMKDGYRLSVNIPDPVVLQPVRGGYIVVSKWGLEASDESLTNEKAN